MNNITADYTLDCQGLSCPMPLLKAHKTLATMASGEILELWSTDPGTKNDIEMAMTNAGNEYLGSKDNEGFTKYFIKKVKINVLPFHPRLSISSHPFCSIQFYRCDLFLP